MKLVRDKIPEIIKSSGKKPATRIADEQEYLKLLLNKLQEEVEEFRESLSKEELADVYEVIDAIISNLNWDHNEIKQIQKEKREKRGGFSKKIILESVD